VQKGVGCGGAPLEISRYECLSGLARDVRHLRREAVESRPMDHKMICIAAAAQGGDAAVFVIARAGGEP
jgi:hypothetical protein